MTKILKKWGKKNTGKKDGWDWISLAKRFFHLNFTTVSGASSGENFFLLTLIAVHPLTLSSLPFFVTASQHSFDRYDPVITGDLDNSYKKNRPPPESTVEPVSRPWWFGTIPQELFVMKTDMVPACHKPQNKKWENDFHRKLWDLPAIWHTKGDCL